MSQGKTRRSAAAVKRRTKEAMEVLAAFGFRPRQSNELSKLSL